MFLTTLLVSIQAVPQDCLVESDDSLEMKTCKAHPTKKAFVCGEGTHKAKVIYTDNEPLKVIEKDDRIYHLNDEVDFVCKGGKIEGKKHKITNICYLRTTAPSEAVSIEDRADGCKYVQKPISAFTTEKQMNRLRKRCKIDAPVNGKLLKTHFTLNDQKKPVAFTTDEDDDGEIKSMEGVGPFLGVCERGFYSHDSEYRSNSKVSFCKDGQLSDVLICVEITVITMKGEKVKVEWYINPSTYILLFFSTFFSAVALALACFSCLIIKKKTA